MKHGRHCVRGIGFVIVAGVGVCVATPARAADAISFSEIAKDAASGLAYHRSASPALAKLRAIQQQPQITFDDFIHSPIKAWGLPGVAVLDFDRDGDEDIYVTNGPGQPNSLFKNLFKETGQLKFVDVAVDAGVAATDQDSTGVCFGDIDNDGDEDLVVMGRAEPNKLFENLGHGRFRDISAESGIAGDSLAHTGCTMGDVNGDGLVDLFVGNSFDFSNRSPLYVDTYTTAQKNQLFLNRGHGHFEDVSESSGIRELRGLTGAPDEPGTITWAVAMVDYDQDGDIDIIHGDDQGIVAFASQGGADQGTWHILTNDGTGHFHDTSVEAGTAKAGAWMGVSFGDFNADGYMDLFGSNAGDYAPNVFFTNYEVGGLSSRWFLGGPNGTFQDPGLGDLKADPFGWGNATLDYDNDGRTDVVFFGGNDGTPEYTADNPGALLHNEGGARFVYDGAALSKETDNERRTVEGVAVGDLNDDGFEDIVNAASTTIDPDEPLVNWGSRFGSAFDATGDYAQQYQPVSSVPASYPVIWTGLPVHDGDLSVQINGGNRNHWVKVRTLGSVGLVHGARVNRDGIGAVLKLTPAGGEPAMRPVIAGQSFGSEPSLTSTFGLGSARRATLDVLWPGGKRNRVYDLRAGERFTMPEIPCSYDEARVPLAEYEECVDRSLHQLRREQLLGQEEVERLRASARRAFVEAHEHR